MLIQRKGRTKVLAVLMALIMAVTVWAGVPLMNASGHAYAADKITINWGYSYSDENAGYLLFNYSGPGTGQQPDITSTTVTLPGSWEFNPGITNVKNLIGKDTKLPDGLYLTGFAFDNPANPKAVTLDFSYQPKSDLFDGVLWDPQNPRRIGVLDLTFASTAIQGYQGSNVKVPIVAEVVKKWEIPYGARQYRELFTASHGKAGINYFTGSKYDWTNDINPSTYWSHPDFYNMGGKYGSLYILPNFRTQQQATDYSCGVSCSEMILNYWGDQGYNGTNGYDGNVVNKVYNKTTSSFDTLDPSVALTEQDLSKLRNAGGPGGSRDWGGATRQSEMENIFTNLSNVYGEGQWNFTSGNDLSPAPTGADAHLQNPEFNVLGSTGSDIMSLSEAIPWYIQHGVPVAVGWQGWGGHYEVIIGYDDMGTPNDYTDDVLILADPYDSVDHLMDGYLIKSWQQFIDDWSVGGWGENLDRFVFLAAWPANYNPQDTNNDISNIHTQATVPVTNANSSLTNETVIKGTDSAAYQDKVASQLSKLSNQEVLSDVPHAGTPYWKTDEDQMTPKGADVTKLKISQYSDFQTIQESARNLDGPASLLMATNYFKPTGMETDIDLAALKGTGKELDKTTLKDMIGIVNKLNAASVAKTGKPAWEYYSTFDMNNGKLFFGQGPDPNEVGAPQNIVPTALKNNVPLMAMAHEGGDQWTDIIGLEDPHADDQTMGVTAEDVVVRADPVDVYDHNPNGLSIFQYEWLYFDWQNSMDASAASPDQTFLAIWPYGTDVGKAKVKVANQVYSGKAKKPALNVTSSAGKTLVKGKDYTVTYSNNTKVGKAKITIRGINSYRGVKVVTFKINPKKTSITKAAVGKGKAAVSWKKVSGTTKYQIRYKLTSAKKWKVKTVSAQKAKLTVTKLTRNKNYQFQVRSYKTVAKVKYYSAWSKTKTARVK